MNSEGLGVRSREGVVEATFLTGARLNVIFCLLLFLNASRQSLGAFPMPVSKKDMSVGNTAAVISERTELQAVSCDTDVPFASWT